MSLNRRTLLASAAASLMLPRISIAETQVAGGTLTTVSDGHLLLPRSFILGDNAPEKVDALLTAQGLTGDTLEPPCNVTLFRDGTNTVLFDTGAGSEFQSTTGNLLETLDAVGVAPEDISHVIFTHAHPDHLWGLLDDFGDLLFANADHHIGKDEWDYWTDPATVDTIGPARQAFAVGAARRLEMLEDTIGLFGDNDEILPGITAMATYGHTPGHMSFQVGNGTDTALVAGDAIGNAHVSFVQPDLQLGSDHDPETAAATRTALLDRLAADQTLLVGFHLPNEGMGRVETADTGYRFVPQ